MNPGGSVKDRAAARHRATRRRSARRAAPAAARSSRAPPVTPASGLRTCATHAATAASSSCRTTSPPEKYRLLEMLGAEVHQVPAVPYSNPNQYQKVAQRLAAALPDAIWSNQFDNTANRDAHFRHHRAGDLGSRPTARVDAFVAASGTGGTLAGVAAVSQVAARRRALRARRPAGQQPVRVTCAPARSRPPAAAPSPRASASAASPRISRTRRSIEAVHVEDADTVHFVYRLLHRGRPVSRQHQRHQRRRRRARGARARSRAHRSSPCCATAARSTSRACSIAPGSSRRDSPPTRPHCRRAPRSRRCEPPWSPDPSASGAGRRRPPRETVAP